MTPQVGFWQRLRRFFQPELPTADDPRPSPGPPATAPGEARPAPARRWLPQPVPRDVSLRLIELVDAMQWHFQRQDERSAALASSLDRMGSTLEQLAETQRGQTEILRAVATHSEAMKKHTSTVADTLGRIPDSLLAQAEAIRTVARQVEAAQVADKLLVESLQQFGHAVDTLGNAGSAQVEALQRLSVAQNTQHETFSTAIREQNRRFLVVTIVFGALAIVALVTICILVALRLT